MRLLLSSLLSVAGLAAAAGSPQPANPAGPDLIPVTVLCFDFAGLDDGVLRQARSKLEGVFRPAGIALVWIECRDGGRLLGDERCSQPRRGDIFLRIVEGEAPNGAALHLAPAGLTEPDYANRGRITLLLRGVRDLRLGTHWQFPDVLALAMAHEFAHLVGNLGHSTAGLMSARWSPSLLGRTTWAGLALSAAQLDLLRQAAARRRRLQAP